MDRLPDMEQRNNTRSPWTGWAEQLIGRNEPLLVLWLAAFLFQSCASIANVSPDSATATAAAPIRQREDAEREEAFQRNGAAALQHSGKASWYGPGFHGRRTASGEIYDESAMTAAHKSLPLGSRARVTNLMNGSSVEVRINDRGPFIAGRIIDLSRAAARALGILEAGVALVRVERIHP